MVNGTAESLCQHGACGGGIRGPDSLLLPPIGTLLAETGQGFMSRPHLCLGASSQRP